jgi:hypothetical protein
VACGNSYVSHGHVGLVILESACLINNVSTKLIVDDKILVS